MAARQLGILNWIHLARIYHRVQRGAAADVARHNLTLPQFDVLVQLNRQQGITQQALAERLLVTKGNICGLIDRMAEQGLVERQIDPEDRRAYRLYLTAKGQRVIEDVLPAHEQAINSLMGQLPAEKQRRLLELLSELDRTLNK